MNTRPDEAVAAIASARLLIHTGNPSGPLRLTLALVLRAICLDHPPWKESTPVRLSVEDIGGEQLLALDDAAPVIDLVLPPGTYQVIARHGNVRRGYTLTLARDTAFDLYLSLADASRQEDC